MGCWFGHKWNTVKEYKVGAGKFDGFEAERITESLARELLAKNAGGYMVIHQECTLCGARRSFHKW
ncbi:hypothetical protein KAR91_00795 [Candidatus Pacearchaeota archaeon]|nr:hypothetical protein [Candidatus Pacearchaeota archaeon]